MSFQANDILCSRCTRAAGCTIPVESGESILSCATFDTHKMSARESAKKAREINRRDPERIAGLCSDCGNKASCAFRQREGGIWHCEEYC